MNRARVSEIAQLTMTGIVGLVQDTPDEWLKIIRQGLSIAVYETLEELQQNVGVMKKLTAENADKSANKNDGESMLWAAKVKAHEQLEAMITARIQEFLDEIAPRKKRHG